MVPFWYPTYWVPFYNGDPKRDFNFDNHPYVYRTTCAVAPGGSAIAGVLVMTGTIFPRGLNLGNSCARRVSMKCSTPDALTAQDVQNMADCPGCLAPMV